MKIKEIVKKNWTWISISTAAVLLVGAGLSVNTVHAPLASDFPSLYKQEMLESDVGEVDVKLSDTMSEIEVIEPTQEPTEPPHIHDFVEQITGPNCTEAGLRELVCACGDISSTELLEALGHSYMPVVIQPTTEDGGYTEYVCERCEYSYIDDYTEKLPYYIEVEEWVYAKQDVNVRKGPGTNYEKLGLLTTGEAIIRLGVGDNDWSIVLYGEQLAYIHSNYLQTEKIDLFDCTKPSEDIENQIANNSKLVGILYIPEVNMVPVNVYHLRYHNDPQGIADAHNSAYTAAIFARDGEEWINRIEIGDHNTHNFSVNKSIKPGMMAYLNMGDKVVKMECISTVLSCTIPEYNAAIYEDDGLVITICCSGDGGRTVNRWEIADDSDIGYEELYDVVGEWCTGHR